MALIKLSGVLANIRGKVGGSVFARTAAGFVMKRQPFPVNKHTEKQSLSRSFVSLLQQEWLMLTAQQRQCWKTWTALNPIKQDNFSGLDINAQQTFIKLNVYRMLYGYDLIRDPIFDKTLVTPVTASLALVSGELILTTSRAMNDSTEFIVLSLTYPVRLTVNNPGSLFKIIIFQTTGTDTFNISSAYSEVFGRLPVSGEKIFIKFTTADKIAGPLFPFQISSIVFP